MAAKQLRFTAQIDGPVETVFDLVADLPNYGRWLPRSSSFGATTRVTPYPVRLGTTYLDAGNSGERPGTVTEFDRPNALGFHHTMALKQGPLNGHLDFHISYTFEGVNGGTSVLRILDLDLTLPGLLKAARPLVVSTIRKENVRTLAALKRFVEAGPRTAPPSSA